MQKYIVPSTASFSPEAAFHSDLGLRASDGWPAVLVFSNGVEYRPQSKKVSDDGELLWVTYGNLIGSMRVYND